MELCVDLFYSLLPEQVWESAVATGTDIFYTWSVDQNSEKPVRVAEVRQLFIQF